MRPSIAIYCLDQDRQTTASHGIFNYTRNLIRALSSTADPGLNIVLLLSSANRKDFAPEVMPAWMTARVVHGSFGTGARRLLADHVLSVMLGCRNKVDLIHFPKGWIPAFVPDRIKIVATLYDVIPIYYQVHYPGYRNWLKTEYFARAIKHSMSSARTVLSISEYSANELARVAGAAGRAVRVATPGVGLDAISNKGYAEKNGFLVIGSTAPHKASRQTLALLDGYAVRCGRKIKVTISGLSGWPVEWGNKPENIVMDFKGFVSDDCFADLLSSARLLVLLSEIEGFGMPALEAYASGTAVCYRNSTALAEILRGIPGGWDGRGVDSFIAAVDEALAIPEERVQVIRTELLSKYNWAQCAEQTLLAYRETLGL